MYELHCCSLHMCQRGHGLCWVSLCAGFVLNLQANLCRCYCWVQKCVMGRLRVVSMVQELRIAHTLAEQEVEGGLSPRMSPLVQVRCIFQALKHEVNGKYTIIPATFRSPSACCQCCS